MCYLRCSLKGQNGEVHYCALLDKNVQESICFRRITLLNQKGISVYLTRRFFDRIVAKIHSTQLRKYHACHMKIFHDPVLTTATGDYEFLFAIKSF